MKKLLVALSCAAALNAADVGYSLPVQGEILKILAPELSAVALIPAGADAHTYEPKPTQMAALASVKAYLAIGVESEQQWLKRILPSQTPIFKVDEHIHKQLYSMIELSKHQASGDEHHYEHHHDEQASGEDHHHGHHHDEQASGEHHHHEHHHDEQASGDEHHHDEHEHHHDGHHDEHEHHHHHHSADEYDVHVWTSLNNLKIIAQNTSAAIAKTFPNLASKQIKRLQTLNERIDAAQMAVDKALSGLRIKGFIDAHPSWGYFAKENGLVEYSLELHGKEIKSKELIKLKDLSDAKKACLIINAPQFSDKLSSLLSRQTGLTSVMIDPLSSDMIEQIVKFSQALSKHCK